MQMSRKVLLTIVFLNVLTLSGIAQKIYYFDNNTIKRANLDGTGAQTVVTGSYPLVAVDVFNGYLFYSNTLEFFRANLDGTSPVKIADYGAFAGYQSMDTEPNDESLLYVGISDDMDDLWIGSYYDTPADNQTRITPAGIPETEYLDVCYNRFTNRVYMTDYNGTIYETDIDGSFWNPIISDNAVGPVAIDYINNVLYWERLSGSTHQIMRTVLSTLSTDPPLISNGANSTIGLDVYPEANAVFFSDNTHLYRMTLTGGSLGQIIGSTNFGDLAIAEDYIAPTPTALTPADGATAVAIASNLGMTFDENVMFSTTTGTALETSIRVYQMPGNTLIHTVNRGDASISIAGSNVTITGIPTSSYSTNYYVQVGSKVFADLYKNDYGGIANTTGWNFTTNVNTSTFYSRANGNWNDPNTWSNTGHTGTAGSITPGTGADVIIGNGNTVTLSGSVTSVVQASAAGISVLSGATLDMNFNAFEVWGNLRIDGAITNPGTLQGEWHLYSSILPIFDRMDYGSMGPVVNCSLHTNAVALSGSQSINSGTLTTNGFEICVPPAVPPTNPDFTNVTGNSVTLSWDAGSGDAFVVMRQTAAVASKPQFTQGYTANTAFGTGSQLGTGNYVVYSGNATTVNITGLTPVTSYDLDMYAFSTSIGGCYSVNNYQFATITTCVNLSAPANPVDAAYCTGDTKPSINVDDPGSGRSIRWFDAATGGSIVTGDGSGGTGRGEVFIAGLASGTFYAETYDNALSCASPTRTAVTLTVNPTLVPGTPPATNQNVCIAGDPTVLSAGTASGGAGSFTYQWESASASGGPYTPIGSATDATFDPPSGTIVTTYYRRVVNSSTCSQPGSPISVTVIPLPVISTDPDPQQACAGDPATFTISATGVVLTYRWQVNTGSGFGDVSNGGVYTGATSNTLQISTVTGMNAYQYQCVVTSTALCSSTTAAAALTVNTLPAANDQTPSQCEGVAGSGTATIDLTTLNNSVTGGVASNTVSWFTNAGLSAPVGTPTAAAATNGTIFYAKVTNPTTTCYDAAQAQVTVTSKPSITTPMTKTMCSGAGTNLSFTSSQTSTSYTWTVSSNANITGASAASGTTINQTLNNAATTQQGITYSITPTANGCAGTLFTQDVLVDPVPTRFDVTGGGSYCVGSPGVKVGLSNSQAGITYTLLRNSTTTGMTASPGGGAFEFPVVTAIGTYTISGATALNCAQAMNGSTDVATITTPSGSGSLAGGTQLCIDQEETYTVNGITGATAFTWELPAGIEANAPSTTASIEVTAISTTSGMIKVTPSNTCGNGLTVQKNISTLLQPEVAITLPENVYAEEAAVFAFTSSSSLTTVAWSFGDGQTSEDTQPSITYAAGGTYAITLDVTDDKGCTGSDTESLDVKGKAELGDLSVKNVVTANGDGANDLLYITDINKFPDNEVILVDRWGSEVFRKKNYMNDWDFKKGGDYLPAGNYVCVVRYNGKVYSRAITVLKQK